MNHNTIIPSGYESSPLTTDIHEVIYWLTTRIECLLMAKLSLTKVRAPLIVRGNTGVNDDLNGTEQPVKFTMGDKYSIEVVQSLAKWKRMALLKYGLSGLVTSMLAIRKDEDVIDNIHSITVDQWDWEKVIQRENRNADYLKMIVRKIYSVYKEISTTIVEIHPTLNGKITQLPGDIYFITSQELEDMYPTLSPKDREDRIVREKIAVFIMKIGGVLQSGIKHDGRAPDYDDWELNGDIVFYHKALDMALEISSMGIRVDKHSLVSQLEHEGCEERMKYTYHQGIVNGDLPLTIGGGIGISRSLQFLLTKIHIGEVQCSFWPDEIRAECEEHGIKLM